MTNDTNEVTKSRFKRLNIIQFMTWTNFFKIQYDIRLWYLVMVLWNCIRTNVCFAAVDKCPTGTFKSDFLSGGCALCPRKLKHCKNEELDDSERCFKACRKIFSTIQPTQQLTTTPDVHKSSVFLHRTTLTTKALEKSPQLYEVSSTRRHVYQKFKTTLAENLRHSTNKLSDESNTTEIKTGIIISIVALLLVVAVLFAICWVGRSNSNKDQQPDSIYVSVPSSSISNCDENMNTETPGEADGRVENANVEGLLPALSSERLNEMPETHV